MSETQLKQRIIEELWQVADRHDSILSATLTGSFVNSDSLAGLSDIDFVVVVDELNNARFDLLQREFQQAVQPVLAEAGFAFRLNPTLGPLKFNAPQLAVLHLMLYSQAAHVEHVINSPFTCLDWQESNYVRKRSLSEVYPTFGLQPRHFLSARRSISDYLRDYRNRVVSYRELVCDADGYHEKKHAKPMDDRDRHEFAYHVMRFLMLNLLKLVRRFDSQMTDLNKLMSGFFEVFPVGAKEARALLLELADKKRRIDYATPIEGLDARLEKFVEQFERQYRHVFVENASRHIVFRHAPTALNRGAVRFQGRSNLSILPVAAGKSWQALEQALEETKPDTAYVSPLDRCRQSMKLVQGSSRQCVEDARLIEIHYGDCEARTVDECREVYPSLFEAWQQGEDPRFPGGENSADVTRRVSEFAAECWRHDSGNSVTCSHNVVLRSLVGELLGVPAAERYRMQIPHMTPISFVATEKFGLFVELDEDVEREIFQAFSHEHSVRANRDTPTEKLLKCKS